MAFCAVKQSLNVDGTVIAVLSPVADPISSCTGYVVQELGDGLVLPPLTHQEAGLIAGACAVVWMFAAACRHIIRFFKPEEMNHES